jgi:hypothetical protein
MDGSYTWEDRQGGFCFGVKEHVMAAWHASQKSMDWFKGKITGKPHI